MEKKKIITIIVGIAVIFGIPIIINECYKADSGYITMWTAADMLSYCGTIIAACGAAVGIFVSIKFSQEQYKEDTRCRALPYFAINKLGRKCIDPFDAGWYEDDSDSQESESDYQNKVKEALIYEEFKRNEGYFVINNNKISFREKLSDEQNEKICIDFTEEEKVELGLTEKKSTYYFTYDIQNIGNGCAVNYEVTLEKGAKSANTFCLSVPVNNTIKLGVFFDNLSEESIGIYALKFSYEDIYGQKYQQIMQIDVVMENGELFVKELPGIPQVKI